MRRRVYSYRYAEDLLNTVEQYRPLWQELLGVIEGITDQQMAAHFREHHEGRSKSLSATINSLIDEALVGLGWTRQAPIFAESAYGDRTWLLDFAKEVQIPRETGLPEEEARYADERSGISVEVAFNHGGNVAWNLIKPVIASEINHVPKAVQTGVGIVIAATDAMKMAGGFDSAVGSYEKYISHLQPLRTMLTVPLVIIGLEPCEAFHIRHERVGSNLRGWIEWNPGVAPLIPERGLPAPELPF